MSSNVKYLGSMLDNRLNFKKHISMVTSKAMGNFFRIHGIRKYLNKDACETLLLDLVISHLDNSNAILYDIPEVDISRMQIIQMMCAKLILNQCKFSSATEAMKCLHWLPTRQRITFKIPMVVHRCLNGTALQYLKDLLVRVPQPARNLRSATDMNHLIVPYT